MSFCLIKFLFSPVHRLRKRKLTNLSVEVILSPYISHKAINVEISSLNNIMCFLFPERPLMLKTFSSVFLLSTKI